MLAVIKFLGGVRATAFAGVAVAALAFSGLQTHRLANAETSLANTKAAFAEAAQEWAEEAKSYAEYRLEQERKLQQQLAAATTEHLKEKAHAKQEYDRTIANLKLGTERLRKRFTCPQADPAVGEPASPAPGSDGAGKGGLLREDAEFLIGEAQRADEIARKLQLAQKTLRIYQEKAKQ